MCKTLCRDCPWYAKNWKKWGWTVPASVRSDKKLRKCHMPASPHHGKQVNPDATGCLDYPTYGEGYHDR